MNSLKSVDKKFKAFIFDLDGTLVDSKHDYSELRRSLGLSENESILETIQKWDLDLQIKAKKIIFDFEHSGAILSTPIPDAIEFVQKLQISKVPSAIFTRNSRSMTELTLKKHNLKFDLVMTRDDGPAKPSPHGLLFIINNLSLANNEALYIGDYQYDLQAGLAAKVPTALYCPNEPSFSTAGAFKTFKHYSELNIHL